jgi:EmrB/QacA subfamily drug resistance transporter
MPEPAPPTAADHHGIPDHVYRRRWWTLSALCLSLMIVFIGNASLNVVIPTLSRQLHASESQLQWVIASYSLVFAGLLFSTGALGDRFGRKGALQLGLVLFLGACVAASLTHSMTGLIVCRAVMGAAAAMIMPSTLSLLVNVFPAEERTKAIAVWAGVSGSAGFLGPVISGVLLNAHYWYGSVFLINVPVCLLALVAGWFLVPKSKDHEQARLDPLGAVLSIIGIVALVYGLIEAPDKGWGAPSTLASFAVGIVVLVLFVLWERACEEPMLDVRYFRNGSFSASTSGMVLIFMSMYGSMFLVTQYFQLILGYSPLGSSVRFMPIAPIMMIIAPLTPRLSARFGANRTVGFGLLLVAISLILFTGLQSHSSYWFVLFVFFPMMAGMALGMSPMTAGIMSAVPPRRAGAGSAMNDATRELGAALGVAVMGSVAASKFTSSLDGLTAGLSPALRTAARSSLAGALGVARSVGGDAGARLAAGTETAFVHGIHLSVTIGALLSLVAAFVAVRYLPASFAHHGAMKGPVESLEDVLELGIAGIEPVFADTEMGPESEADDRAPTAGG